MGVKRIGMTAKASGTDFLGAFAKLVGYDGTLELPGASESADWHLSLGFKGEGPAIDGSSMLDQGDTSDDSQGKGKGKSSTGSSLNEKAMAALRKAQQKLEELRSKYELTVTRNGEPWKPLPYWVLKLTNMVKRAFNAVLGWVGLSNLTYEQKTDPATKKPSHCVSADMDADVNNIDVKMHLVACKTGLQYSFLAKGNFEM